MIYDDARMPRGTKKERPYSWACGWLGAPVDGRTRLRRQVVSDLWRIKLLGDARGQRLDALGMSYEQARWVAGVIRVDPVETEKRYHALVAHLEDAGTPGDYRKLKADAAERAATARAVAP